MAPAGSAHWVAKEEAAFIDFLVENKSEAGDGLNFKAATFQKASAHLAPLLERGAPKNAKSCGNKYTALRKIFRVVVAIQSVSGWTWDDNTGASIDVHTESSWNDYVQVHPEAKPFRNKGWPHFRKMQLLMPTAVKGGNAYHPTLAPPPVSPQPSIDRSHSSNGGLEDTDVGKKASERLEPAEDSSDIEDLMPPVSSAGTKRRREPATPATPTKPSSKRPRASHGASALMSMAESLGSFNTTLATALAPPSTGFDPTPVRRTNAVTTMLRLEKNWLTTTQRVRLVDFLKADQSAADVYLALATDDDIRKEWVRIQLENLGVYIDV